MCNEIKEFNGIKYREDNNEITITGYLGMDENLNIPSEIDGKKVIGIEDKTAAWSSALKSITIPDTVTKIEGSVLMNCKDLVSIKVDENNKNYADKDGVLFSKDEKALIKYPRKKKGFSYVIPNTVTSIESSAFYNSRLRKITIPSGVVSIGDYAFDRSKLEEITIPDTVMNIGDNALRTCESLVNIKVDENNKNYADKDGVLFSKGEKVLIKYPKGKMEKGYTIPDTVTRIEDWAFYDSNLMLIENSDKVTEIGKNAFCGCDKLRHIKIPESLKVIEEGVFFNCANLMRVTIPDSVTDIKDNAFCTCLALTDIIIPNSVTSIGDEAFGNCINLNSIEISQSVKSMEDNALKGCDKVTIYGDKNSYAETYAKENSISFKAV